VLNWPRLRRGWRRLLAGSPVSFTARAAYSWTIHPEEQFDVPPAVCLESSLERITGLSPWRDWETERLLISGGRTTLPASRAWVLENVDIVGPSLYTRAAASRLGYGVDGWLLPGGDDSIDLDIAALVTTWSGSRWFGPYLIDDLPLEMLGPSSANISLEIQPYTHEAGYRRLLGLVQPRRIRRGRVKQLVFYQEPGANAHKANRYRVLRARLRERIEADPLAAGRLIYLKRGRSGEQRVLLNEDDLEARLRGLGFDVVEAAGLSVDEVVRRTMDARCVVSIEGSHKSHCVYTLADKGALVILQPPDRFALNYKDFPDYMGMRCGFVVGTPGEGGFRVPLDELERVLHLVV
jgi:hypothetical protein